VAFVRFEMMVVFVNNFNNKIILQSLDSCLKKCNIQIAMFHSYKGNVFNQEYVWMYHLSFLINQTTNIWDPNFKPNYQNTVSTKSKH